MNHLLNPNPHGNVIGPTAAFLERINERAHFAYVPAIYPGALTIFKPRRNYAFLRDPLNGWGEVAAGGLEFIELPVDPGGIFVDPYVRTLADKLRACIDASC